MLYKIHSVDAYINPPLFTLEELDGTIYQFKCYAWQLVATDPPEKNSTFMIEDILDVRA